MTQPSLSEAAVREEIIAPILKKLGYRSNSANDIRYELNLRYPRDFLGHKKTATDPPIRGKADYVCNAGGRVAWTVEAKPSGPDFTIDDVEQAFTYARHPEVRATYFCLCNGREWRVYATDGSAEAPPLRTIDPRDPKTATRDLESLLGPTALQSRFAAVAADSL
jgi:predicted type IV restriction endonuclease